MRHLVKDKTALSEGIFDTIFASGNDEPMDVNGAVVLGIPLELSENSILKQYTVRPPSVIFQRSQGAMIGAGVDLTHIDSSMSLISLCLFMQICLKYLKHFRSRL